MLNSGTKILMLSQYTRIFIQTRYSNKKGTVINNFSQWQLSLI